MKPKFIALNLLLLAGVVTVAWQARAHWIEAQEARTAAVSVKIRPSSIPPLTAEAQPEAPRATTYADVAAKNLFSKDRNPTVVIDPPKVEKPREMPALPVVYGVMGLPSGTKALMAENPTTGSRSVRAGDTVGQFKIAALNPQTVIFDWEGKQITRNIDDLIDRTARNGNAATGSAGQVQQAAAPPPPPPSQPGQTQQPGNPPPPQPGGRSGPSAGIEAGAAGHSEKVCAPGDSAAPGTVTEGYRKTVTATPFGSICRWVAIQ